MFHARCHGISPTFPVDFSVPFGHYSGNWHLLAATTRFQPAVVDATDGGAVDSVQSCQLRCRLRAGGGRARGGAEDTAKRCKDAGGLRVRVLHLLLTYPGHLPLPVMPQGETNILGFCFLIFPFMLFLSLSIHILTAQIDIML